jgi:Stigma-specific protein, Stig1
MDQPPPQGFKTYEGEGSMTTRPLRAGPRGVLPLLVGLALSLSLFEACSSNAAECPSDMKECGDVCSIVEIDPQNCGACGKVCSMNQVCSNGACGLPCGQPTEQRCGDQCVQPATDNDHCGSCGNVCDLTQYCENGQCRACLSDFQCEREPK